MRNWWAKLWGNKLGLITALTVIIVAAGSVGYYYTEPAASLGESVWWAFTTMTTVGYGDETPKSGAGRVVAVAVMFGGVAVLGFISATIASYLVHRRIREDKGLEEVTLTGHTVVANWNSSGSLLLEQLARWGDEQMRSVVLVNELGEGKVSELSSSHPRLTVRYVHGDPTRDVILGKAAVADASVVIILASEAETVDSAEEADSRTIKIAMGVRHFSKDAKVFAEMRAQDNERHLRRAGADEIISSSRIGAFLLASAPLSPGLTPMLQELLEAHGNIFKNVAVPGRFVGQPFKYLFQYFRSEKQAILLGLVSESKPISLEEIMDDDDSFIDAFIKRQFEEVEGEQELLLQGRFRAVVNPADDYVVGAGDRALVIVRVSV